MPDRLQWVEDPARILRPQALCVDPITLTGLALGGLAGAASGALGGGGGSAPPSPQAPPPQAPPQKTPAPKQSVQQSSFIGGVPAPPPSTGQKTLLGQ